MADPFNTKQLNYRSYINTVRGLYEQPTTQTSTALIFTLLTIAFFGLAAIRPTLATISELQAELKEKKVMETELTDKINTLSQLQQEFQDHEDSLEVFDTVIPHQQDLDRLLLEVEYLAAINQTPLRNIRLVDVTTFGEAKTVQDEEEDLGPFESLAFSVTANGSYDQLMDLLKVYDSFDRYVMIESMSFSQPTEEDADYELSMNVTMRVYWSQTDNQEESL